MQDGSTEFRLLDWAMSSLMALLAWFGGNAIGRISKLERGKQDIEQARIERGEIKDDIHDLSQRMDSQHNRILERIDTIGDAIVQKLSK